MFDDVYTVNFVFVTGAQIQFEANLKEKFGSVNTPLLDIQCQNFIHIQGENKFSNIKKTIDILERNKTIEAPSYDCHWKIMDS